MRRGRDASSDEGDPQLCGGAPGGARPRRTGRYTPLKGFLAARRLFSDERPDAPTPKSQTRMSEAAAARRLRPLRSPPLAAPRREPRLPSALCVPRPRLVRVLAGTRRPLALVAAPAGYGKTTLIEEWERADPRPFAWVTIDRD